MYTMFSFTLEFSQPLFSLSVHVPDFNKGNCVERVYNGMQNSGPLIYYRYSLQLEVIIISIMQW